MTCREKLAKDRPDCIGSEWDAGCRGCPSDYNYMRDPKWCHDDRDMRDCIDCWLREFPEEKSNHESAGRPPRKGEVKMDINRYNTRVRQAISDKYVECTKRKQEIGSQLLILRNKLTSFMDNEITLTYKEYIDTKSEIEALHLEHDRLDIERDVWNAAREICLDIADEMDAD